MWSSRIEDFAGSNQKTQLNEYHVLVTEVLGGVDTELIGHGKHLVALESKLENGGGRRASGFKSTALEGSTSLKGERGAGKPE